MNNIEKFMNTMNDLEDMNGLVFGQVKYEDGKVVEIEEVDYYGYKNIAAIKVYDLADYEKNGYNRENLEGTWLEYE